MIIEVSKFSEKIFKVYPTRTPGHLFSNCWKPFFILFLNNYEIFREFGSSFNTVIISFMYLFFLFNISRTYFITGLIDSEYVANQLQLLILKFPDSYRKTSN